MTEWDGVERRQQPSAVAEVRGLKDSVLVLAEAVGQSMNRDELVTRMHTIIWLLVANVVMNLATLVLR